MGKITRKKNQLNMFFSIVGKRGGGGGGYEIPVLSANSGELVVTIWWPF